MKILLAIFLLWPFGGEQDIPVTNQHIIAYVKQSIGKKIDTGECWDLANAALNAANAKWTPPYQFGKPIDYKTEKIIPGDIMQINNVTMESKTETSVTRWKMVVHTAILFEVGTEGKIKVAEQNVNGVRKVMISNWNLNDIKSGKMQFYRPQPK